MNPEILPAIELETASEPDAAVIWLHGLGADGNDFAPIVPELRLPASARLRFVFPHAPTMPVTINNGYVMRAWYDIAVADFANRADERGVRASVARVEALVAREKARGIAASRIVLAGFSQGGVVALETGIRHAERLAGIMALSTYLALPQHAHEASPVNRDVPVFMAHGTQDPVVRYEWGRASSEELKRLGYSVEWHEYRMQHSVCLEEVVAIGEWLTRVLAL
jgi:phospholipase/carboxylesterase